MFTDEWNFETDAPASDVTLYAKWSDDTFTVKFNMQGAGTQIDPQVV